MESFNDGIFSSLVARGQGLNCHLRFLGDGTVLGLINAANPERSWPYIQPHDHVFHGRLEGPELDFVLQGEGRQIRYQGKLSGKLLHLRVQDPSLNGPMDRVFQFHSMTNVPTRPARHAYLGIGVRSMVDSAFGPSEHLPQLDYLAGRGFCQAFYEVVEGHCYRFTSQGHQEVDDPLRLQAFRELSAPLGQVSEEEWNLITGTQNRPGYQLLIADFLPKATRREDIRIGQREDYSFIYRTFMVRAQSPILRRLKGHRLEPILRAAGQHGFILGLTALQSE